MNISFFQLNLFVCFFFLVFYFARTNIPDQLLFVLMSSSYIYLSLTLTFLSAPKSDRLKQTTFS